ncbi:MAG TPA: hypothetical protein VHP63_00600, partial [candidate division Zixibacteria bacterium]|nr:hypothetical protein [candidate division Zixibacteria bacterium]
CSADRGGDVFDVVKSLARHNNPAAPTEGPVSTILIEEMREISQLVFKIFESQYISNRKNVFELTEKLTLEDFLGDNYNFVERKISSGEVIRIQDLVEATKSQVKSFVVYQLGSSHIESGVGCGYFDVEGKGDKHQIQKRINDYLFDICFNPEIAKGNYEHFLDYLMLNFASTYKSFGGLNYKPYLNEFTRVIFEDRLSKYWNLNGDAIKASNFGSRDKTIRTGNYTANYNVDLPGIFDVLDMLVKEKQNS